VELGPVPGRCGLALSTGPNRVGFTRGLSQIPVSESSFLVKIRTVDNVQNVCHCHGTPLMQTFGFHSQVSMLTKCWDLIS
jgi:hypothetical protein